MHVRESEDSMTVIEVIGIVVVIIYCIFAAGTLRHGKRGAKHGRNSKGNRSRR